MLKSTLLSVKKGNLQVATHPEYRIGESAYPLAIFRLGLYAGLALHFAPPLIAFDENFGANAYRMGGFSAKVFALPQDARSSLAPVAAAAAFVGILGGFIGGWPRTFAIISYISLYVLMSLNSFSVHTLALSNA